MKAVQAASRLAVRGATQIARAVLRLSASKGISSAPLAVICARPAHVGFNAHIAAFL